MWLEVLSGEDAGRVVEVDRALVLGRVQGADLVIRDARASRRHAELVPEGDELRLHDLGSVNGTFVGEDPVEEALLQGGEEIRIGGVRIAVLAEEPAVTGAPIAEAVRPGVIVETEGPSWSMIGRLVEARTQLRMAAAMDPRPEYQEALGEVSASIAVRAHRAQGGS
jgi:hypothetical protein